MSFRRALYYIQFGALLVLPAWVFAGRGLFGVYLGWHFRYQCFICPLAFLALLATLLLTLARTGVRENHAVSKRDAVLLTSAYSFGIAYGFFMIDAPVAGDRGSSVFTQLFGLDLNVLSYTVSNTVGPIAAVLALAALWSALRQLPQETRERIRGRIWGLLHPLHQD
ncbi:hypothetical protein [Parafrigoribacterium soli]|uniref:hypothetical protein n=1 Tax=Parafrigoribacterium soli TaxID=3144663 RepID=UPI0032ED5333